MKENNDQCESGPPFQLKIQLALIVPLGLLIRYTRNSGKRKNILTRRIHPIVSFTLFNIEANSGEPLSTQFSPKREPD